MWKPEHRLATDHRGLRYPYVLADAEWALITPLIPPAKRGGRKCTVDVREALSAISYMLATGCQWKALPKDLLPKCTAHSYFMLWHWSQTLGRIREVLYVAARKAADNERSPSVAVTDSQSAKALKRGSSVDPQGCDAGRKSPAGNEISLSTRSGSCSV
jgi:transposase